MHTEEICEQEQEYHISNVKFDGSSVHENLTVKNGFQVSKIWPATIDSGANRTCISLNFATSMNLPIIKTSHISVTGFDGSVSAKVVGYVPHENFFIKVGSKNWISISPLVINHDCNLLGMDAIKKAEGGYFYFSQSQNRWRFAFNNLKREHIVRIAKSTKILPKESILVEIKKLNIQKNTHDFMIEKNVAKEKFKMHDSLYTKDFKEKKMHIVRQFYQVRLRI